MRIGLNLLHLHPGIGGVWQYVENLLAAVARLDPSHTWLCFVTEISRPLVPRSDRMHPICLPVNPMHTGYRILVENTRLHLLARQHRVDCMHWFANVMSPLSDVPGLVSLYDLLPLRNPDAFSLPKRMYLHAMLRITAQKARVLLPMSHATARDVRDLLNPRTRHIRVVPAIVADRFRPRTGAAVADFRCRYGLPERFWVYVAHFYPHKNHAGLLRAFRLFRESGSGAWPLVLRGDSGPDTGSVLPDLRAMIAAGGMAREVMFLPRMPREDLPLLYAAAGAMVFPSRFEGAGIPVLEAMACGCPVLASDIGVIHEHAGAAAYYCDTTCPEALSAAMARIQADPDLRAALRRRGLVQASCFSGARVIPVLMQAYRDAATGQLPGPEQR